MPDFAIADPAIVDLAIADTGPPDLAPPRDLVSAVDLIGNPHRSMRFDGEKSAVLVYPPSGAIERLPAMTVEWWFRPEDMRMRYEQTLVSNLTFHAVVYRAQELAPEPQLYVSVFNQKLTGTVTVAPFEWHHVALQYQMQADDSIAIAWYFDGSLRATGVGVEQDLLAALGKELSIGGTGEFLGAYRGLIDELRISNVARYSADFVPGDVATDPATLLYFHFDQIPVVTEGSVVPTTIDERKTITRGEPHP